jgi:hypothetical protein
MNPKASKKSVKRRPVDWAAWSIWSVLFLVLGVCSFLIYRHSLSWFEVWVPVKDLPAYHLIIDSEVMKATKVLSSLSADVISGNKSPVDQYTRRAVSTDVILSRSDVVFSDDPQLVTNTTPISIPATEAMTFSNRLTSGEIVVLWQIPAVTATNNATPQLLIDRVLVLDVLPASSAPAEDAKNFQYIVILAVPIDHQTEVLSAVAKGSLVFTLCP